METDQDSKSCTKITDSDLADYLPEMGTKWFEIALKLGCGTKAEELRLSLEPNNRKCWVVISEWKDKDEKASWEALCAVLRSPAVGLNPLAIKIEQEFCLNKVTADTDSEMDEKQDQCFGGVEPPIKMFTRRIERVQRNPDNDIWETEAQRDGKIRNIIADYFLRHKELETETKLVTREVAGLIKDGYITGELAAMAEEKVVEYERMLSDDSISSVDSSSVGFPEEEEPLFSKANAYHALLCCLAIGSSPEEKEVRRVINDHGHEFQSLSISRSDCSQEHGEGGFHGTYLIAKKGDIHFVAFNGIPELTEWSKYQSYSDGLLKQARNVPANYLFHLIRNKEKVIFTGHSFGGALACTVMANMVCDNDIINQEVMKMNMCCITFGQPLIADDTLAEMMVQKEQLRGCVHHIYTEDVVPILLRYVFASAVGKHSVQEQAAKTSVGKTCRIVSELSTLQRLMSKASYKKQSKKDSRLAVSTIQQEVDRMNKAEKALSTEAVPLPLGSYHYVRSSAPTGDGPVQKRLELTDLSLEDAQKTLLKIEDRSKISSELFTKHTAKHYFSSVFTSFIDSEPKYSLPDVAVKELPQVVVDHPRIDDVDIYCWDEDINIVISGNDLWFVRSATVHKLHNMSCCLQTNNCNQLRVSTLIQENVSDFIKKLPRVPKVCLRNCFLSPVTKEIEVQAKNMSVPPCNIQIAKLAPPNLIILAVLSTVLENVVPRGSNSERCGTVQQFLRDGLKTVPAESLFIAGYTNHYGDEYCRSAVKMLMEQSSDKGIPPSKGMFNSIGMFMDSIFIHNHALKVFEAHMQKTLPPGSQIKARYREPLDNVTRSYLNQQGQKMMKEFNRRRSTPYLCGEGLDCILNRTENPLKVLDKERDLVQQIAQEQQGCIALSKSDDTPYNERFLKAADCSLKRSISLACALDSFMRMQVKVPLVQNPEMTAKALERGGSAIGAWYLVGMNYLGIQQLVKHEPLVIEVSNFLEKYLDQKCDPDSEGYSSKIGFILQAMKQPVTYSTTYISYSLEIQLKSLCNGLGITASTPVLEIRREWDQSFKGTALAHVAVPFRPIIARWIKWMLVTNRLRESLAKRTTIGIMGLLNSGKSHLLNCLFHTKAPSGTREAMRTTIPMVYNMDSHVKQLDVVDFPGVDDSDERVRQLSRVMFDLVQISVYVVDYRKAHSKESVNVLKYIAAAGVPVLICLTHADKLISEIMPGVGNLPDVLHSRECIARAREDFLQTYRKRLKESPPECVEMACFAFDKDSIFALNGGRQHMKDAGVKDHSYVAAWIAEMVCRQGQVEQAKLLKEFFGI